jgi:hypothetical protein
MACVEEWTRQAHEKNWIVATNFDGADLVRVFLVNSQELLQVT